MMASRLDMEAEHQAGHGQVHTKHSTLVQKKTDDSGFVLSRTPVFAPDRGTSLVAEARPLPGMVIHVPMPCRLQRRHVQSMVGTV